MTTYDPKDVVLPVNGQSIQPVEGVEPASERPWKEVRCADCERVIGVSDPRAVVSLPLIICPTCHAAGM